MESTINKPSDMTEKMFNLFVAYAKDNGNWSGTPQVGGNVNQGRAENMLLSVLKTRGYLTTFVADGCAWIRFTAKGNELMEKLNINYYKG
jgi:hypothetical protein